MGPVASFQLHGLILWYDYLSEIYNAKIIWIIRKLNVCIAGIRESYLWLCDFDENFSL